MKACVYSQARCASNLFDNSRLKDYFEKNDLDVVASYQDADLILVNTCAFTQKSENDSIAVVKRIQREKKGDAEMVVFGCLVSINRERLKREFNGVILSHDELHRLDEIIKAKKAFLEIKSNFLQLDMLKQTEKKKQVIWKALNFLNKTKIFSSRSVQKLLFSGFDFSPLTYYVQISTGCLGACSYCAVRYARGKIKSKPVGEIIEEIKFGLSEGYKDFVLVSEDSGVYGRDINTSFNTLLSAIAKMDRRIRVYIYQINPSWIINSTDFFIEQVKKSNIVFVCVPVQSGSNKILRLMNRKYQIEDVKKSLESIKNSCPDLSVASHFMVGFPGEAASDFQDTINFVKKTKFDSVAVFRFGARPRTPAKAMPNQISEEVKLERLKKLERVVSLARLRSLKLPFSFSN